MYIAGHIFGNSNQFEFFSGAHSRRSNCLWIFSNLLYISVRSFLSISTVNLEFSFGPVSPNSSKTTGRTSRDRAEDDDCTFNSQLTSSTCEHFSDRSRTGVKETYFRKCFQQIQFQLPIAMLTNVIADILLTEQEFGIYIYLFD